MKKTMMVALAAALVVSLSADAHAMKIMLGGKGGFNLADMHGADADGAVPINGFGIGAFGVTTISEKLSVQLEGLWMQKGAEDDVTKLQVELDYLEFPLTAVATVPLGDYTQIVGFAGPVISFLMSANSELDKASGGSGDVKDQLKTVDFGGTLGLGAWFTSGSMMFTVDLRWTFGFTSITDFAPNPDLKNNVISFFGGVAFPIGG